MDAKARPEKPIDEAIKALKIDPPSKASSITMSGGKGASLSDATSCISSGDATSSIKEIEVDQDVSVVDEGTYYYGYYYPGSHGVMGEWDNSFCNRGTDNVRVEHPVSTIQTDSGSLIYYLPGFQTGYSNYGPFSPGPMYCADGQFWGQGSYYPSPVSPQTVVSPGFYAHPIAYGPELIPAYPWDPYFFFQDVIQGNTFTVDPTNSHYKPNHSSNVHNLPPSKTLTISKATSLASDLSRPVSAQNQTQKSVKKAPTAVLPQGYVPLNKLSGYANQVSGALLYPNSAMPMKENRRCWDDDEKLKARNKLNGLADLDLLNEQNRGPRTTSIKTTTHSGDNLQETLSIKQNDNCSGSIDRDEYNSPDFITMYEQALFFVIKSYSEDDVHKSIKYNVWSSTPNGNKRLDNAFQAAQGKLAEKGGKCPVFLFFSVNASGQFCGVAEMTGRVDFSKNMSFWQQDKWNGFFPVKWHIIKDVPNPRLRHIILENNENKPVTNSRDTQEVKFPQGTEMLNIFKSYSAKTSILDDFGFYENRQKAMQEKRSKPTTPTLDNSLPPKMVESSPFQKLDDSKSHKLVLVEVKEALPCSTVTSPK